MIVEIDAPYVDAAASSLRVRLDGPRRPAAAVAHRRIGAFDVELRLLTASHQVILSDGQHEFSETIACLGGTGDPLTTNHARRNEHFGYAMTSRVDVVEDDDFAAAVQRFRAASETADGLVGVYPGNPLAMTGVHLEPSGSGDFRWHTWHSYPQSGEIVVTDAVVTVRQLATSGGRL